MLERRLFFLVVGLPACVLSWRCGVTFHPVSMNFAAHFSASQCHGECRECKDPLSSNPEPAGGPLFWDCEPSGLAAMAEGDFERAQLAFSVALAGDREAAGSRQGERAPKEGVERAAGRFTQAQRPRSPGMAVRQAVSEVQAAKQAINEGDARALAVAGQQGARRPLWACRGRGSCGFRLNDYAVESCSACGRQWWRTEPPGVIQEVPWQSLAAKGRKGAPSDERLSSGQSSGQSGKEALQKGCRKRRRGRPRPASSTSSDGGNTVVRMPSCRIQDMLAHRVFSIHKTRN